VLDEVTVEVDAIAMIVFGRRWEARLDGRSELKSLMIIELAWKNLDSGHICCY
jgi:hypothetical protein